MLLLRNAIWGVLKSPCGHDTAQKCNLLNTKSPCGHVTAQKCYFLGATATVSGQHAHTLPLFMSLNNSDAELQKVSCEQEHAYVYARRWQATSIQNFKFSEFQNFKFA